MSARIEHKCPAYIDSRLGYGAALCDTIDYDAETGLWVAGNGEYGTAVRYCPWCGLKLASPGQPVPEQHPLVTDPTESVQPE